MKSEQPNILPDEQIDTKMKDSNSELMSMPELKELYEAVKKSLLVNTENEQVLVQVNDVINMLAARVLSDSPQLSEEQTKYLYQEFLPGVAKRILQVKSNKDSYVKLIAEIANSLINLLNIELQAKTLSLEDLADACRVLFDPTQKFFVSHNQKVFMEEEAAKSSSSSLQLIDLNQNFDSDKVPTADLSKMSAEDKQWRNSLKLGDMVDVVKYDEAFDLKAWSKGKVDSIIAGYGCNSGNLGDEKGVGVKSFMIGYYKDISVRSRLVRADELIIAPYNSKTSTDSWRENLFKGQAIKAMSRTCAWFNATVVEPDPRQEAVQKMTKIGFREYSSVGDKADEMGQYFGLSERVDEHIGDYSLRLQPAGSNPQVDLVLNLPQTDSVYPLPQSAQTSTVASTSTSTVPKYWMDSKQDETDILELENNEIKFVTERKSFRNTSFVQILNDFGKAQGFENMLAAIQAPETSIELLFYLVDCVGKISILLHKSFIDNYLDRLQAAVLHKIINASESQIRSMKQHRMEELVNIMWDKIMARTTTITANAINKNLFNFEIGALFIRQNFFERRIDGARIIDAICKQALINNNLSATTKDAPVKSITSLLVDKLTKHDILERYYSKRNVHSQLIQRSSNVLKVLLSQNVVSNEQLEMIWTSVDQFDDMRFEFYSILKDIASSINPAQLYFFIQKLNSVPFHEVKAVELELMERIISGQKKDDAAAKVNLACGLEFFWGFMHDNTKQNDTQLLKKAILCFSDIIKHAELEIAIIYFDKITDNLQNQKQSYTSIKIIYNYFNDFVATSKPQVFTKSEEIGEDGKPSEFEIIDTSKPTSKYDLINYVNDKYNLFDMIFQDLSRYMKRAKVIFAPLIEAIPEENKQIEVPKLSESTVVDQFPHNLEIDIRLKLIHYIASNSATSLTKKALSTIWDELIKSSPLLGDHQIAFKWIRGILDDCLKARLGLIDEAELIDFFKTEIASDDADHEDFLKSLNIEGYYCIQSFFLLINQKNRKLYILGDEEQDYIPKKNEANTMDSGTQADYAKNATQSFTSYSNTTGSQTKSYSFAKNQTSSAASGTTQTDLDLLEVMIRAAPQELEGIRGLWRIAIDCNDKKVSESVAALLLQLHTNVDFELRSRISEFENQFIISCIALIQNNMAQVEQRDPAVQAALNLKYKEVGAFYYHKVLPVQEKRIVRCLTYIKMLIQNSEEDGLRGSRPHSCLKPAEWLSINVQNAFKTGQQYRQRFQIGCYNNTTVFELKKMIAWQLSCCCKTDGTMELETPPHPCSLKLTRATSMNKAIGDTENGTTLGDLAIKSGELLTVCTKGFNSVSKYPLLNDEKTDLNARAIDIFSQIFYSYAVSDPEKPEDGLFMRNTEVMHFVRGSTNENCEIHDSRVQVILNFAKKKDGKLTLQDFLNFYRNSCIEKGALATVRNNLRNHNFRQDLQQDPKPGQDDNILQIRPTISDMPRFKLAQNQAFFQMLFKLLTFQTDVHKEAMKTLKMLNTNLDKFWSLLWLQDRPDNFSQDFSWDKFFKSENLQETMYVLEILESFLVNDYSLLDQQSEEARYRRNWLNKFISLGGFLELIDLLNTANTVAKEATKTEVPGTEVNTLKKNFLDSLLRIISIFVLGAQYAEKSEAEAATLTVLKRNQSTDIKKPGDSAAPDSEVFKTPEKSQTGIPFVNAGNKSSDIACGPDLPPGFESNGGVDATMITQDYLFGSSGATQEQESKGQEDKNVEVVKDQPQANSNYTNSIVFKKIVQQMREAQQSEFIFNSIDFSKLQQQLLEIITLILSRNQDYVREDTDIIRSAMDLWVVCMIENPQIKSEFYQWTREAEPIVQVEEQPVDPKKKKPKKPLIITNAQELLIGGLFSSKGQNVRKKFQESLEMFSERVTDSNQRPLFWLLNILVDKSPVWDGKEETKSDCRDTQEFFALMTNLLLQYKEEFKIGNKKDQESKPVISAENALDFEGLILSTIEKMKKHQCLEVGNFIVEDKTMSGYMIFLKELLIIFIELYEYDKLIELNQKTNLLHELFFENLFFMPDKTRNLKQNKCQHKDSRVNAYKLLFRLGKSLQPKDMCVFLEDYLWQFIKDVPRPLKWRHTPAENSRKEHCGIKNLGNICYMISMLQQFYMVPQFRYQLLRAQDNLTTDLTEVEYKGNKMMIDDNLLHQLQKLFASLESSERSYIDPIEFCFSYKDFDGQPTNTAIQCDAQEFLNFFFDRLESILAPTSQKYLCQDVFQGRKVKQQICKSCGFTKNRLDDFYTLSLQVKNKTGVHDSLKGMLLGDVINDWKCEACNQKVDLHSIEMLADTPNVLIVHLQRICFSFETFNNVKINSSFDFPEILDLKQYSFGELMRKKGKTENDFDTDELKNLFNVDSDEYIYRLVGVNIHRGTGTHGHYWSLINTQRGHLEKDPVANEKEWLQVDKCTWKEFNDESVSYFNFKNMAAESFGGDKSGLKDDELAAFQSDTTGNYGKSAYMLVYERKKKKSIREVQSEDAINKINYSQIQKYVDQRLENQVRNENTQFVIDKQIFHAQFFMLVKLMINNIGSEQCLVEHRFDYAYKQHGYFSKMKGLALQIGQKVMFDFLTHFFENVTMQPIADAMGSILTFSDSYVNYANLKEPSILLEFIKKTYLADNCDYFFEIMFKCVDQSARNWIGSLTTTVMNKAMRIYGLCSEDEKQRENPRVVELGQVIDEFMTKCLLKLQERECQKQWSNLKQYFEFLCNFGKGGKHQTIWMLTKFDVVADLIDFMLQDQSPRAAQEKEKRISMNGTLMPAFGPLVKLVSHLVRSMHTKKMAGFDDAPKTFVLFKDERNSDAEKMKLDQQFILSDETLAFVVNTDFMQLVLKNEFESEEYAKAISHVQFGDKALTKTICKFLLKYIVTQDWAKISTYLDVVEEIVQVQEKINNQPTNLQRKRLEWIFGIALMNSYAQEDKVRIGLDCLFHNIKSEVFEYRTMLTFEPKQMDSLLWILWRYQGRQDNYAITALEYLLVIINSDDTISDYFASLPPVTYQFARYTDWIKPYLQSQLAKANAGYGNAIMQGNKELIAKVLSLYDVFEAYLKQKTCAKVLDQDSVLKDETGDEVKRKLVFDRQPEDVVDSKDEEMKSEQIDTAASPPSDSTELIKTSSPSFIVLKSTDENYLAQISSEENPEGVYLTISQLNCTFCESKPTGFINKAIPDQYLNKYNVPKPEATNQKTEGTSAAAMLKQREAQLQGNVQNPEKHDIVIKDGNEQWANINVDGNMVDHESDGDKDKGYACDNEGEVIDKALVKEVKPSENVSNLDDSFDDWQGEAISSCADLVYKFTISNTTNSPIQFRVKLKPKNEDSEINLYWPTTGLRGSVAASETLIVALLPKLRPVNQLTGGASLMSEVEKLDIKLWWQVDASKESLLKTSQNKQEAKNAESKAEKKGVTFNEDVQQVPTSNVQNLAGSDHGPNQNAGADTYAFNAADFAGDGEEKSCSACTFLNPIWNTRCSCCDTLF